MEQSERGISGGTTETVGGGRAAAGRDKRAGDGGPAGNMHCTGGRMTPEWIRVVLGGKGEGERGRV